MVWEGLRGNPDPYPDGWFVGCGRGAAGRPSASRRSVILPRRRGGGKHFFRVPRPAVRSGPAIAVTTRFRETSRTFLFAIPGMAIQEDPIAAQRRPGRVDLPTDVFHRKRKVSVQPRAAGTPNEPGDGNAVADRSDRSQRRRGGKDSPTGFSAVPGVCPRTTMLTGSRPINLPFLRPVTATPVQHFVRRHSASVLSRGESYRTHHLAEVPRRAVEYDQHTKPWGGSNDRRQC
jgi:hypothetical protein